MSFLEGTNARSHPSNLSPRTKEGLLLGEVAERIESIQQQLDYLLTHHIPSPVHPQFRNIREDLLNLHLRLIMLGRTTVNHG